MQEDILFPQLKELLDKYGRWGALTEYINRINTYVEDDFSVAVENSKALLEAIAKTILKEKGIALSGHENINKLVKLAFKNAGYSDDYFLQISGAIVTISQQVSRLRTTIGATSHGMPIDELGTRNSKINDLTRKLIIHSTEIVAVLLIEAYEIKNPRVNMASSKINYDDEKEFNDFLDEVYGEFKIGEYSYTASEILYNVDYEAYKSELNSFLESKESANEQT